MSKRLLELVILGTLALACLGLTWFLSPYLEHLVYKYKVFLLVVLVFLIFCGVKRPLVGGLLFSGLVLTALYYGPSLAFEVGIFYRFGLFSYIDLALSALSCVSGFLIGWLAEWMIARFSCNNNARCKS